MFLREDGPAAEAMTASMGLRPPWYGYGDGELEPLGEESAVRDMAVRCHSSTMAAMAEMCEQLTEDDGDRKQTRWSETPEDDVGGSKSRTGLG